MPLKLISWMITLSSDSTNEYGCVYAWTKLGNIATLLSKSWQCCRKCANIAYGLHMFVILWKKWKKLASSSINHSVKNQKQCVNPQQCLLLWQKMCVKCHKHQFTIVFNNWTFRGHHWDEFCIKTFVWLHTKFNWFRSWLQLTI